MALLLKKIYLGYFYVIDDLADPRCEDYFLMSSPLPTVGILGLWLMFIFKWGPTFMKDREPFNLKRIMIVYNIVQVFSNAYILYHIWFARQFMNWRCNEIDYSRSYHGLLFVWMTHKYFLLKLLDLLDTVFFVLRKKSSHMSFLHIYHHFGMGLAAWFGTKFLAGGQAYFIGLANCIVHIILYSYYLLTAYDSKYSRLLWLKKFITQAQLFQFAFLFFIFAQLFFLPQCNYPKLVMMFFMPQNFFMMVLFGDFYYRTYHSEPRKRRKELEKKMKESYEENEGTQKEKVQEPVSS